MKIKAYFVTYKNNDELNLTLESFRRSGITNYDHEIKIINNAPDHRVVLGNTGNLNCCIIINETRATFSTGHLSRNWNECLIDGFKNIDAPDADIVILSQNDNTFYPDFIPRLIEQHKTYSFIQNGAGDTYHSYTPDAIRKVGLWDERFCNIGYQDGDYMLRQMIFNQAGSSIHDVAHGRVNNPLIENIVDYGKTSGCNRHEASHHASMRFHHISGQVFFNKWAGLYPLHVGYNGGNWDNAMLMKLKGNFKIAMPQFIMYPYFETFAVGNQNYWQEYI